MDANLLEMAVTDRGSATTAGLGAGAVSVPVDDPSVFNDSGGTVQIDGAAYDYTDCTTADDGTGTLTLAAGVAAAVDLYEPVLVMAAGQVVQDWTATVDFGDGDTASIPVPYGLRAILPEGAYDPPVLVTVSDDLSSLVDVPGRAPVLDGTYIDPATLPAPAVSDGFPPSSSPTPTVTAGIHSLFLSWTAVTNADFVTYEVHVSTTSGFTPTSGTLVAKTAATLTSIQAIAGTPLTYGTTYYVKLVATDVDGAAAPSAQASGVPIQVATGDIAGAAVDLSKLASGSVDASKIVAGVVSSTQLSTSVNTSITTAQSTADGAQTTANSASSAAAAAQSTANTKVITFIQSTSPTATETGDLWIDTGNGNLINRWSGTAWVAATIGTNALAASAVTAAKLASNSVSAASIIDGTVTSAELAANSVTNTQITDNSVSTAKLQANSITAATIAAGAVGATQIAANAIVAGKIAANAVTTGTLAAGVVTATELAANAVVAGKVAAGAVTTGTLAAGVVGATELAANSIVAGKIAAGTVDSNAIAAGSITADRLVSNSITADQLASSIVLAGTIDVGSNITIDSANGINITTPSGPISFPTDGVSDAQIAAHVTASSLDVLGQLNVRGTTNQLAPGATLALGNTTTPPTSPPSIASTLPNTPFTTGFGGGGWAYYSSSTPPTFFTGVTLPSAPFSLNAFTAGSGATSAVYRGSTPPIAPAGVEKIYGCCFANTTGQLYTLLRSFDGNDYVAVYNVAAFTPNTSSPPTLSLTYVRGWLYAPASFLGTNSPYAPSIGTDAGGTNVVIAQCGTSGSLNLSTYSPTGALVSRVIPTTDGTTSYAPAADVTGLLHGSFDFGATKYIPVIGGRARTINGSSNIRESSTDWSAPGALGLGWDGTAFSMQDGDFAYTFTAVPFSPFSFTSTWRTANATSPAFALYESKASLSVSFTPNRRWWVRVTTAAIPADGTTPPDSISVYAGNHRVATPAVGVTTIFLGNELNSLTGGAAPSVGTFPSATPASVQATTVDGTGAPAWQLNGDGTTHGIVPVGAVQMFAGSTVPTSWLLCDGSAVSRTTYAALFAVCSTTYGSGNGSTTFNLPDMAARFPVGPGGSGNYAATLGSSEGQSAATRNTLHSHTIPDTLHVGNSTGAGNSNQNRVSTLDGQTGGSHNHTGSTGGANGAGAFPHLALNFIIRAL